MIGMHDYYQQHYTYVTRWASNENVKQHNPKYQPLCGWNWLDTNKDNPPPPCEIEVTISGKSIGKLDNPKRKQLKELIKLNK